MPTISKIRFTNVIYDNKQKRFNDDIFNFEGQNAVILLENGGGKTVFTQCAIQAIIPHAELGGRKIKDTLLLDNNCAHIAIEWILKEKPRKYCVTAVSLYKDSSGGVTSYRFVNEYSAGSKDSIEFLPFSIESRGGSKRAASREEIGEYYSKLRADSITARTFTTIQEYQKVLSKDYGIIESEWRSQLTINGKEGDVEKFFDGYTTTGHLVDNLLIPSIESVIAGDGEKGFARTFESQRDNFKEYNRLMRVISESDLATERLNTYVNVYKKLNEREQTLLNMKRQTKSLQNYAAEELEKLIQSYNELNSQKAMLNEELKALLYKKESLIVLESKEELFIAEKDLAGADQEHEKSKEAYDEKASRRENINLNKSKHEIDEWQAKISIVKEEIGRIEEDTEITELRDEYDKYACQLRGSYVEIEDELHSKRENINIQMKKCDREKDMLIKDFDNESKKVNTLYNEKTTLETTCAINNKRISELKRKILIDVKNDRVEDVLNGYNKRLTEIENIKATSDAEINAIEKRIAEIKAEQPIIQDKREQVREQFIRLETELQAINEQIQKLTIVLSADYREFYNLKTANFYHKEKTIIENFTAIISKLKKEKEDALLDERLKKRLTDAYDESLYFTGEPGLYGIIEELKNRFDYIQAGGQFVKQTSEALKISKEEIMSRFPFWNYVVVTLNEADALKFKQELETKKVSTPVLIVTLTKAREIAEGVEAFDIDTVIPDFWVSNLEEANFRNWKEQIRSQGAAAELLRCEAEDALAKVQANFNDVRSFLTTYSHESYMQMNVEKSELGSRLDRLNESIEHLKKEINSSENARNSIINLKNSLERETDHINKNREHAQEVIKMEMENKNLSRDIMRIDDKISEVEEGLKTLKLKISDTELRKEDLNRAESSIYSQISVLQNEHWYKVVREMEPDMRDSIPKNALIERLESLKLDLLKIEKEAGVLVERLSGYKTHLTKAEDNFKRLKKEAKYPWEVQEAYYDGMELELVQLEEQLPNLLQDMKNKKAISDKLRDIWLSKKALYDDCLIKFKKSYYDVYAFQQSLNEVRESLQEEEKLIKSKNEVLNKEISKTTEEMLKAEKATNKLKEMYRVFNIDAVEMDGVEFEDILDYPYNRLKVVENMDINLQQAFDKMKEEYRTVDNAKREYCEHCRNEMSDVRYRDRLIGIAEKTEDYASLLREQKEMNALLERARALANTSLAEREEKMFQFTNNLYTHVEKIVKELRLIPKKTRIRAGGEWKEIFDINIAEWTEQEARMSLRLQVNYILDKIENNPDFKTDDGTEDISRIKAFIEKSLKTNQLLKRMMGSNEIRVRCRKVTNDNQVSSRFYSWEESEKWSGGERWSKNMALFLGIQSYISEKTEPDLKVGKSYSCVLLDNPFGKASSEHVLNPVFFIAKELGFQIITVTAHAEGKFIVDYFPIVYSLRLREALGGKTRVITKELAIKHAYFEEQVPGTV